MPCKCYHADKNFFGEIGVCWGTKECEACSCGGDESKCDFYDYVRERAKSLPQKQTHGDRIRDMTDEELAEWIANEIWKAFAQGAGNPFFNQEEAVKLENQEWLDWLKEEVDDGNNDH